ncbi:type II secretion system protein [Halobacillus salinus]|uniref:Type II secretion system protein n=1 Tax=Halobacillus salinus TaxID=192814 RepID=A0A4Z0H531_9BACI|nr:type II secretion system protein [Halobacillus salinus]TGB04315.1 type II secretion system protein [Halobacillus salinus]
MNYRGFTLAETIFSFSLFLLVTLMILPLLIQVKVEQKELSIKRQAISSLHDQIVSWREPHDALPYSRTDPEHPEVLYTFQYENGYIQGCADFNTTNMKEVCLYVPS